MSISIPMHDGAIRAGSTASAELEELQRSLSQVFGEYSEIERDMQYVLEENETLFKQADSLTQRNTELETENLALAERLEEAHHQLEIHSSILTTEGAQSSASDGYSYVTWSSKDYQTAFDGIKKEMERKSKNWITDRDAMEDQLQKYQEELHECNEVANKVLQERNGLKRENSGMQDKLKSLESAVAATPAFSEVSEKAAFKQSRHNTSSSSSMSDFLGCCREAADEIYSRPSINKFALYHYDSAIRTPEDHSNGAMLSPRSLQCQRSSVVSNHTHSVDNSSSLGRAEPVEDSNVEDSKSSSFLLSKCEKAEGNEKGGRNSTSRGSVGDTPGRTRHRSSSSISSSVKNVDLGALFRQRYRANESFSSSTGTRTGGNSVWAPVSDLSASAQIGVLEQESVMTDNSKSSASTASKDYLRMVTTLGRTNQNSVVALGA
jgi:regulator of replication initiation timing